MYLLDLVTNVSSGLFSFLFSTRMDSKMEMEKKKKKRGPHNGTDREILKLIAKGNSAMAAVAMASRLNVETGAWVDREVGSKPKTSDSGRKWFLSVFLAIGESASQHEPSSFFVLPFFFDFELPFYNGRLCVHPSCPSTGCNTLPMLAAISDKLKAFSNATHKTKSAILCRRRLASEKNG